jgi:hypothetical protein
MDQAPHSDHHERFGAIPGRMNVMGMISSLQRNRALLQSIQLDTGAGSDLWSETDEELPVDEDADDSEFSKMIASMESQHRRIQYLISAMFSGARLMQSFHLKSHP